MRRTAALMLMMLAACGDSQQQKTAAPLEPVLAPRETDSPTTQASQQLQMAGASVAAQGASAAGVPACTACHGDQGQGNAALAAARLAGQPRDYLEHQLQAFADGSRQHSLMSPIAKALTPAQRRAVVAYYAVLRAPPQDASSAKLSSAEYKHAEELAVRGDEPRRIQACANCHGPGGRGEAPVHPSLAGQPAAYLRNALQSWRDGSRRSDGSGQMPAIAQALSAAELPILANYFAAQTPPPPTDAGQAAAASQAPP